MSTLNGETIEELLWENGLDFEHTEDSNELPAIEIYAGVVTIVVTEAWDEGSGWFIDTDSINMIKYIDGDPVESTVYIDSECDFINKVMEWIEY